MSSLSHGDYHLPGISADWWTSACDTVEHRHLRRNQSACCGLSDTSVVSLSLRHVVSGSEESCNTICAMNTHTHIFGFCLTSLYFIVAVGQAGSTQIFLGHLWSQSFYSPDAFHDAKPTVFNQCKQKFLL